MNDCCNGGCPPGQCTCYKPREPVPTVTEHEYRLALSDRINKLLRERDALRAEVETLRSSAIIAATTQANLHGVIRARDLQIGALKEALGHMLDLWEGNSDVSDTMEYGQVLNARVLLGRESKDGKHDL